MILISGSRAAYLGMAVGALYFFLLYPKKMKAVKIAVICIMILAAAAVFYASSVTQYPKFIEQNRLLKSTVDRLSVYLLLTDPRFYAYTGIDYKILLEKPVLGYGPENFSVGFDKFYDPSIPYLNQDWGDWWDRAHNIILQTGSDAGFLGIATYLALFIILFWQLQKTKSKDKNDNQHGNFLMPHAIQATLIGYFIANLFTFDSFSTYLIFFLLIGYSLHLIYNNASNASKEGENEMSKKAFWKPALICILFIILVIFLWQYNFVPFAINAQINEANDLVNQKNCSSALSLMDKIIPQKSILDSYSRIEYVEFTKTCNDYYPQNNLAYTKKDLELANEAIKIQPLYTRFWLLLGSSTANLAAQEKDTNTRNAFINQAENYFQKALQLSPKHQEIIIAEANMELGVGDYQKMQDYSKQCIALNPGLPDCYWYLALSDIYLKNINEAQKNIQKSDGYNGSSQASLNQLSDAYGYISDYQDLVPVYQSLILLNPNVAQYHSSLAFFYEQLGQYDNARQEALKVLQISPESKPNVDAFLNSLPK